MLKEEIKNSKYKVVGCIFNNEYQNLEYEIKQRWIQKVPYKKNM